MLIFGIVFNLVGLGFFCWLLFALAVHALPVFVGVTAGLAALHSGAGAVGAVLVALVSGVISLIVGQIAFAATRSPPLRAAITALFAAPAAIAGYHVALGLADISASSAIWREAFALTGAVMVGGNGLGAPRSLRLARLPTGSCNGSRSSFRLASGQEMVSSPPSSLG